jgi:hypothetical protein
MDVDGRHVLTMSGTALWQLNQIQNSTGILVNRTTRQVSMKLFARNHNKIAH